LNYYSVTINYRLNAAVGGDGGLVAIW